MLYRANIIPSGIWRVRVKKGHWIIFWGLLIACGMYNAYSDYQTKVEEERLLAAYKLHCENFEHQFLPGYKAWSLDLEDYLETQHKTIDFTQGKIFSTQTKSNLAVNGKGFFVLEQDGQQFYTRDGRFEFYWGELRYQDEAAVLGYALDNMGQIQGELAPIRLTMDPTTQLFEGKYIDYKLDECGKLYGVQQFLDPVVGQRIETSTPLFQVALAKIEHPELLTRRGLQCYDTNSETGPARVRYAGTEDLGAIRPGSLELSNSDYMKEGAEIVEIRYWGREIEKIRPASNGCQCQCNNFTVPPTPPMNPYVTMPQTEPRTDMTGPLEMMNIDPYETNFGGLPSKGAPE